MKKLWNIIADNVGNQLLFFAALAFFIIIGYGVYDIAKKVAPVSTAAK